MTYANAVLPHALFVAAQRWPEEDFLDVAEASFAFLDRETTVEDVFWPVGNSDWYPRGEEKSLYDQQPVEAVTMAEAALAAIRCCWATRSTWLPSAAPTAGFMAAIACSQPLVDVRCGACCDGLQAVRRESQPGSGIDACLLVDGTATEASGQPSARSAYDESPESPASPVRGVVPSPRRQPHPDGPRLAVSGQHGVQRRRVSVGR